MFLLLYIYIYIFGEVINIFNIFIDIGYILLLIARCIPIYVYIIYIYI